MTTTHPMQRTFDELRRARRDDPQTSRDAARQARGLASDHVQRILAVLREGGSLEAHEIAPRCGLTSLQVSRRLGAMRDDGLIVVDETRTVLTSSGRRAQCWRVN